MSSAASLPWYRHRWPWFLIAGPGIVVVASFVTLWLAIKSSDGLVVDDYYKKGLAINRTLDRSNKAKALDLVAEAKFTSERVVIKLSSKDDLPGKIRVTIAHPTRAGFDQSVLLPGVGGSFQGAVAPLTPGRWQVIINDEANTWRLNAEIQLPEQQQITIRPTE